MILHFQCGFAYGAKTREGVGGATPEANKNVNNSSDGGEKRSATEHGNESSTNDFQNKKAKTEDSR